MNGESNRKKVDESWKDSVAKEKATEVPEPQPGQEPGQASRAESEFSYFISSLGMQAMVALGQMEDPHTGTAHVNLQQAKYLVDTLQMINTKTKGNLTPDEATMMKELLYQLQMHFVKAAQTVQEIPE